MLNPNATFFPVGILHFQCKPLLRAMWGIHSWESEASESWADWMEVGRDNKLLRRIQAAYLASLHSLHSPISGHAPLKANADKCYCLTTYGIHYVSQNQFLSASFSPIGLMGRNFLFSFKRKGANTRSGS